MDLKQIRTDEELVDLGYKCKSKLRDLPFYKRKDMFERLWLWEKKGSPPIITLDESNGNCSVVDLADVV